MIVVHRLQYISSQQEYFFVNSLAVVPYPSHPTVPVIGEESVNSQPPTLLEYRTRVLYSREMGEKNKNKNLIE